MASVELAIRLIPSGVCEYDHLCIGRGERGKGRYRQEQEGEGGGGVKEKDEI